jgi:hypothetical protein
MTDEQIKALWLRVTGFDADGDAADIIGFARALLADGGKGEAVTLTGAQLLEALDFVAPDRPHDADQLECEVTIQRGEGHDGPGTYCWLTEYPEEGATLLDGKAATQAECAPREAQPCEHCDTNYPYHDMDCPVTVAALAAPTPERADPTDPGYDVSVLREHVRHLERRIRQLAAGASERADAEKDAARYQWLRDNCFDWEEPGEGDAFGLASLHFEADDLGYSADSLDASIDAAILAADKEKKS